MTVPSETSNRAEDDISSDSFSVESLALTWKTSLSSRRLHAPHVPSTETGRTLRPPAFVLCLVSVSLLSSGLVLLLISILVIKSRCKYKNVLHLPIFDWGDMGLFSGLLSIASSCIACVAHENRRNYVLLPFFILCLAISLAILTVGITVSILNRTEFISGFASTHIPPQLKTGTYQTRLKYSMISSLEAYYDRNNTAVYRTTATWDDMQYTLKCCGVNGPLDWSEFSDELPKSCYQENTLQNNGCLDLIAVQMAGQMCLSAGVSLITLTIQLCSVCLAAYIYFTNKAAPICCPQPRDGA